MQGRGTQNYVTTELKFGQIPLCLGHFPAFAESCSPESNLSAVLLHEFIFESPAEFVWIANFLEASGYAEVEEIHGLAHKVSNCSVSGGWEITSQTCLIVLGWRNY